MKPLFLLFYLALISCAGLVNDRNYLDRYANILAEAYKNSSQLPLVTDLDSNLKLDDAYKIQKQFVRSILRSDRVAGYKIGVASKASQRKFPVDSPVSGVLFQSGENLDSSEIKINEYNTMLIETELGFRISEKITKPIVKKEELYNKISGILPVIEHPDVRFRSMNNLRLIDLVAANVGSFNYIIGNELSFREYGSKNICIKLESDGNIINEAKISDFMEKQIELLKWLINKQLEIGWEINPGQILITGAIGKISIGKAGEYKADYGELGKIKFKVSEK